MPTIKEQFLLVHNDIIRTLDNRFVNYLNADLNILFNGTYPQEYETLLLSGSYNSQIQIGNTFHSPYADDFFDLVNGNVDRSYLVKFSFIHNYCFNQFCIYFEIIANGLPIKTAQNYFNEFKFFLNIQVSTTNNEYNTSYKSYWRELLLRVKYVLENGGHQFYNLFTINQITSILLDLTSAVTLLEE
jgi:hypothetical protein